MEIQEKIRLVRCNGIRLYLNLEVNPLTNLLQIMDSTNKHLEVRGLRY